MLFFSADSKLKLLVSGSLSLYLSSEWHGLGFLHRNFTQNGAPVMLLRDSTKLRYLILPTVGTFLLMGRIQFPCGGMGRRNVGVGV